MASSPIISWQIEGEKLETVTDFIFLDSKITVDSECSHEIKRYLFLEGKLCKPRQHIKKQRHHFSSKGPYIQSYGFSSSHVWIHKLDHKEGWVLKNWCFQIVLEKTLESPLDSREIKPVNLKGDQPWIFIRRTSAEAPVLWSCDKKSWLTGKDPDAGNDWGQEKGTTEVEMVGWHHRLNEHELDQHELGDSNEQGSLVCCSPWGRRVGHDLGSEQQQWLIMISTFPCAFFFFFKKVKVLVA